jgi:hypothetical protein
MIIVGVNLRNKGTFFVVAVGCVVWKLRNLMGKISEITYSKHFL